MGVEADPAAFIPIGNAESEPFVTPEYPKTMGVHFTMQVHDAEAEEAVKRATVKYEAKLKRISAGTDMCEPTSYDCPAWKHHEGCLSRTPPTVDWRG